jgi:hypothetical protein
MENGGIAPPFFTFALDGGEWLSSRPCRFTLGGKRPRHLLYSLGGPQSRSGRFGVEKNLLPLPEIEP